MDSETKSPKKYSAGNLSQEDKRLNRVLSTVEREVKSYAEHQFSHLKQLADIGLALSSEGDMNKLLEMIVDAARDLSFADAGTLYLLDERTKTLRFEILQNDSMNTRMGGESGDKITLPPVPIEVAGKPNYTNVSSYVAISGETVNIADVYEAEGFDFTGPRKYDKATGYRSKSMLVIPMRNHEGDIIGVLQLLNAKDVDTGEVVAFSSDYVDLVASLASQAAVALTNAQLVQDLKNLLYSFIKSIAAAIDEKSPYTAGHIERVVKLTTMIAEEVNSCDSGLLGDINFSEDEMEELKLAAWMHDVGKITTPEYVVDKRTKLETIHDRVELIAARFDMIEYIMKSNHLEKKLHAVLLGEKDPKVQEEMDLHFEQSVAQLREDKEFVAKCNVPKEYMDDEKIKKIAEIASKKYEVEGKVHYYLTSDEAANLSIRKGSLTAKERHLIENHALVTKKMLSELPFPKKLARVPEFASGHHEKLDGSGYPSGLTAKQLSIQARIMVIADIFEALTAKDRPYKEPMGLSQALKILEFMKKDGHIDPDIHHLFMQKAIFNKYAEKELNPEQADYEAK
ncbi:MAG: HD domain-containing protein [Proteobacteria bacterium]|nr:HD domain-containing protein [Pseudomonadota bacterium]